MKENTVNNKKKVVIVGAGVSGLAAGIYLCDNGYDVEIYEKHDIPGGECTGWVREGQYIDGCAHWIIGTNPNSQLYPLWEHVGAFKNTRIYKTEALASFDLGNGESFFFGCDLNKLEKELLEMSPKDKRAIRSFVRTIEAYTRTNIPVKKPLDHMNIFELMVFGLQMLPMAIPFAKYRKVTVKEYAKRFKDPRIGRFLTRFMGEEYNMHSLFYVLQSFLTDNAGITEGGSVKFVMRMVNTFKEAGGKLFLSSPTEKIVLEGNRTTGIQLENGSFIPADYVICTADVHHTFTKLLPNELMPRFFKDRFEQKSAYPIRTAFQLSWQTTADLDEKPRMMDFEIDPVDLCGTKVDCFALRNFSFDKSLSRNHKTLLTALIPVGEITYDNLAALSREDYLAKKQEIGEYFTRLVSERVGIPMDCLKLLDVASPLTYNRYANAYKGSYMSFIITEKSKGLMIGNRLKGVKNLLLSGQWLMPPGGLPVALFTGKHAAYNVCYLDKKKFINKEKIKGGGFLKARVA